MISAANIIQKKRDGHKLRPEDIRFLISGFMTGEVPDYQMSAWLMAVFFRGLTMDETLALTDALVESGQRLDLSALGRKVVDKHSTGGVGDKVTLVLGPVVAVCGAVFGKMSGRGLGHTGGTIDKLESIPGFRTDLTPEEFIGQLRDISLCVAGQTTGLTPADKKLYALRDVTATIDSNPLVAASIMSKKIAAGATSVVLDVKVGKGSFFKSRGHAAGVSHLMKEIGSARGIEVEVIFSCMEQPLGMAVGNSLEVLEAAEALKGHGASDLMGVVTALAARLLTLSDRNMDGAQARESVSGAIASGAALAKFREWIKAQGGDDAFVDEPDRLPLESYEIDVNSVSSGYVASVDALEVGRAVLDLGAGRCRAGEKINHGVGVLLHRKSGDRAEAGSVLARVYACNQEDATAAAERIRDAYIIGRHPVEPPPLFL